MKTILVPANLHLPMYQKLLKENQNQIDVQIISLNSFIYDLKEKQYQILYQYQLRKDIISKSNTYYESMNDLTFLKSCLSFIRWCKLYDIHKFPKDTKKEQDLNEIIQVLYPIDTKENHIKKIEDISSIQILRKPYSDMEMIWIQYLLEHGASYYDTSINQHFEYHTSANSRKEAELICLEILEHDLYANDCFVCTNNESQNQVLAQMMDQYHIPYTFLNTSIYSSIVQDFYMIFDWILNPSLTTFLSMIQLVFPAIYNDMNLYYTNFPENFKNEFHMKDLDYEFNNIIDEYDFNRLKKAEQRIIEWNEEHQEVYDWTIYDFTSICQCIQDRHPFYQQEDVNIYKAIQEVYRQSLPYLNQPSLFLQFIETMEVQQTSSEIKGVLIGSLKDCNAIRSHVFIMGAHTKNFPGIQIHTNLFDEDYIRHTALPSLQERLAFQLDEMKNTLFSIENLYISYAQSDYEGKNYEPSPEIEDWFHKKAEFVNLKESSVNEKMKMEIHPQQANQLFFKNTRFSVSRLESFARCPFSHYLKYGLNLRVPTLDIAMKGTILHSILETLTKKYQKEYVHVDEKEIEMVISHEFDFYRKVYPNQSRWIHEQILEYKEKVILILKQLSYFEEKWHMNIKDEEYHIQKEIEFEDMKLTFTGYIDRIDSSNTSFCIFDYKSSKKELKQDNFQAGLSLQLLTYTIYIEEQEHLHPTGCFYVSLSSPCITDSALKVSYPRSKPGIVEESKLNCFNEFTNQKFINGWAFDGFDNYMDDNSLVGIRKNTPSFSECKEQWNTVINGLLTDMKKGNIQSQISDQSACSLCSFRRVCRNNRQIVAQVSYIDQEEE